MYKLLMFLGMTQVILGVLCGLVGVLIEFISRARGNYENQAMTIARRSGFVGLWLILVGFVTVMAVFVANWRA